ncbi:MAG: peptide chain release factor N(5)-glutamine methyltransferase [Oribacterium sp.]|nr:peptide chain release factor N(5)-glutamine methyltransferase [Oribacterium sp.]
MTFREMLKQAEARLTEAGVTDAGYDARVLLERAYHLDTARYLAVSGETPEEYVRDPAERQAAAETFAKDLRKRAERIPLQQILGEVEFYGHVFKVNASVLCPRQDTEVLVEAVIQDPAPGSALLDLCTGSGCIAISVLADREITYALGVDISEEALRVAEFNRRQVLEPEKQDRLTLLRSDLYEAVPEYLRERKLPGFDILVSNPPYIPSRVVDTLEPEVRDHEPRLALDGAEDGLLFYRRLLKDARSFLNPGGRIYFEIGYDQGEAVRRMMEDKGFHDVEVIRDFGGNDRVVKGYV